MSEASKSTRDYDVVVRSAITDPTLSVIVAIHDMERNGYLADCLASFDAQDCEPGRVEYVLADDCSTDGSFAQVRAWAEGRGDATVIHLHRNMRQGAARNRAIDEARGRWLSIVDADDAVSPDYVSWILSAADETGADAIVVRWIQLTDEGLKPIGERRRNLQSPDAVGELDDVKTRQIILKHWQFGVWPRRLFDDPKNRFLEGIYYEDTPVGIRRILQLRSVAEAGGGCYLYRQNPTSTTHTTHGDMRKLEDRLVSSIAIVDLAKSLGQGVYERYRDELEWYFLQVGLFDTLDMAAKGDAPADYIRRVACAAHERADMPRNPYYRAQPLAKRLFKRLMWDAPVIYCRLRGDLVRNETIRMLGKKLLGR